MKGFELSELDFAGFDVGVGRFGGFVQFLVGGFVKRAGKSSSIRVGRQSHRAKFYHTRKAGDCAMFNSGLISHFVAVGRERGELETGPLDIAALNAAGDGLVDGVGGVVFIFVPCAGAVYAVFQGWVRGQKLTGVVIETALDI